MYDAFIWLLAIELLGLLALPISFGLFARLPDRGIPFAKPLALLLCAYLYWLLGHILPTGRLTVVAIVVVLAGLCFFLVRRHGPEILEFLRDHWRALLAAEVVFLAIYAMWVAIGAQSPAIATYWPVTTTLNTEMPMDFGFLNAILRADQFPPEDPWLSGNPIGYYYFGHLMVAFLTKVTGISSAVSVNLGGPLVAAMVAAGAFSLVYNLVRMAGGRLKAALLFALAGPLFVGLIGSLEGVMELIFAQGWGSEGFWRWVGINGLMGGGAADSSFFPQDYLWWWHAARVMNIYTADGVLLNEAITEFPFFILLMGDLHAHMMSLPFLVLNLALFLNLFMFTGRLDKDWLGKGWWKFIVAALFLGSLAFINLWDFPVFAGIFVAVLLVKSLRDEGGDLRAAALSTLKVAVPVIVLAVIMFLPFYLRSIGGRTPLILPLEDINTRPFTFMLIWGLFLTITVAFLLRQFWALPRGGGNGRALLRLAFLIPLVPLGAWVLIELLEGISSFGDGIGGSFHDVGRKLLNVVPILLIVGGAFYGGLTRASRGDAGPLPFVLILLAMGFLLLMGVELFYLDDLFYFRLNTVFKAYFQVWVILAIVSAFGLYYWWSSLKGWVRLPLRLGAYAWAGLVAALIIASLYYPLGAALNRADEADDPAALNSLAYLGVAQPGEYQAILWLREDAPWGRIVEAVGGDYSDFARISSSTGLPTILGWPTHEEHWRGSPRPQRGRVEDVERIYRSSDLAEVQALLSKYEIRYVFVGPRERSRYPGADLDKFSSFMDQVYDEGAGVVIYEWLGGQELAELWAGVPD